MSARSARLVAENMPHHVLQRGNRRQNVFFSEKDKKDYLRILQEQCQIYCVEIWAYCLMDNHVHLIVTPHSEKDLAKAVGETHKRYTRIINFREGWRGYLWEGRFKSFILDERYLHAAVRYVERNPVRAGLIKKAEDYSWSSAPDHAYSKDNGLLSRFYLLDEIKDWSYYLSASDSEEDLRLFRRHGQTGRPLGSSDFMNELAGKLRIDLTPKRRGRKPKK
jgi:putative transposase